MKARRPPWMPAAVTQTCPLLCSANKRAHERHSVPPRERDRLNTSDSASGLMTGADDASSQPLQARQPLPYIRPPALRGLCGGKRR